jgi:hypothetical protein
MIHIGGQIVLIAILVAFLVYILRLRTVVLDRILYIVLAVAGISLVLDPDLTSTVAHMLGIGRGTDLLFYFFVLAAMFFAVTVSARMRALQRQVSQLISAIAQANPEHGPELETSNGNHADSDTSNAE